MSNKLTRYDCGIVNWGLGDYSDMIEGSDGSYINRDQLKEKLEKALADAAPDGSSDALREVLSWLGED